MKIKRGYNFNLHVWENQDLYVRQETRRPSSRGQGRSFVLGKVNVSGILGGGGGVNVGPQIIEVISIQWCDKYTSWRLYASLNWKELRVNLSHVP